MRGGSIREAKKLLDRLTGLVDEFRSRTEKLAKALEHQGAGAEKHAKFVRDNVVPAMASLRETGDENRAHRAACTLAAADISGNALRQIGQPSFAK